MGDQQAYPLVPQSWEFRLRYRGSVKPGGDDDEEGEDKRYPQHGDTRAQGRSQEWMARGCRVKLQTLRSA